MLEKQFITGLKGVQVIDIIEEQEITIKGKALIPMDGAPCPHCQCPRFRIMEVISRKAFGFKNFQNYRLRVIALCGWDGVFVLRN